MIKNMRITNINYFPVVLKNLEGMQYDHHKYVSSGGSKTVILFIQYCYKEIAKILVMSHLKEPPWMT